MKSDNQPARLLIIEDDVKVAESLHRLLTSENYAVELARTAEEGIPRAQTGDFDAVITDLQMPGVSGLEVITTLHPAKPHLPIILVTGHHTTETAIKAIKLGAYDYVLKPITNPKDFLTLIQKAVASHSAAPKPVAASEPTKLVPNTIVGRSAAMQRVYKEIGRVAARPVVILIRGETGTGKELVARALHRYSDRAEKPFVIVNCVAIPAELLESELFGHEQGSFTGAQSARVGKFEQADKGTIFLDEIGDMSLAMQAKLLRVLQENVIRRVGGAEVIGVDVRVMAATHCDLEQAVREKRFREDLYYRLNDASVRLPALRERREDIPDLVHYFLHQQPGQGTTPPVITPDALRMLQYHAWPGNVRELKNVVQQATVLARGYSITFEIVRRALEQANSTPREPSQFLDAHVAELLEQAAREGQTNAQAALTEWVERELYGQAIRLAEYDQSKVARWLGVSRPTVRERLMHYGLHPSGRESERIEGVL